MLATKLVVLFLLRWISFLGVHGVPIRLFYPYGPDSRDNVLRQGDDISSNEFALNTSIAFFNNYYQAVYINVNGHVSFDTDYPNYQATMVFPINKIYVIAPFFADIDTRGAGRVYYRETTDLALLQRAAADIQAHFKGQGTYEPRSLLIVTWDNVGYYNQKTDKVNTFQLVVASDGRDSFAFFQYLDEGIEWITGDGKISPTLIDVPAQAGFDSPGVHHLKLPYSGTTSSFVNDTNVNIPGVWMFHIGNMGDGNIEPADLNTGEVVVFPVDTTDTSCLEGARHCHINAKCVDMDEGFCCECLPPYYGNGKECLEPGVPQRLNGKVNGVINGIRLDNLDMHTYVVTSDGRAYSAISRVPSNLGTAMQTLSTVGGIIGWMFAVQIQPGALNGYSFTGGEFNRTAEIIFLFHNTTKRLVVRQRFFGHDALNNLRMETHIDGELPDIEQGSKVTVDDYKENYKRVGPGTIKSYSSRTYRINDIAYRYTWDQTLKFKECSLHTERNVDSTMRLTVSRNFVVYDNNIQVVRYAMSNKVGTLSGHDPCRDAAQICDENADCVPDGDSHRCVCRTGYTGDGSVCQDIDECEASLSVCDSNARCYNVHGSFQCQCLPGYRGDGRTCNRDQQLCGDVACSSFARCVFNSDLQKPQCECSQGYKGNGVECRAVESGCNDLDNCGPNAECVYDSDELRYRCECLDGFSGDGEAGTCSTTEDRTDCRNCDPNAQCIYDVQRIVFRCQCNAGYTGDGYRCSPIDPCVQCSPNADCFVDPASQRAQCRCKLGYYGDGQRCESYDCRVHNVCHQNAECILHPDLSLMVCQCKAGYRGDGRRCEPEGCSTPNDCDVNAQCLPDPRDGSLSTCRCNPGYEGDGRVCIQRIVPCNQVDNCGGEAECIYDPDQLSYRCRCRPGYEGDGYICRRREPDDCRRNPGMCDPNAACVLNVDRYVCMCNQNYRGNGESCRPFEGDGNYLIYAQGFSIMRIPYVKTPGDIGRRLIYVPGQLAVGVDTDCYDGYLYWTDVAGGQIRRSFLNGSEIETLITGLVSPEGIAVDWVARNIYYTDSELDIIGVARLNGTNKKVLFSHNVVNPRSIVVDPRRGVFYWTDWNRNAPQIERANMDGTEREVMITSELGLPNGLSFDHMTQTLCWGDAGTRRIECIRADGLGRRIVYGQAPYPFDVAYFNNVLYWSDWESKGIQSINREGGDPNTPLNLAFGGNGRTYGITAVTDQCPRVTNACALNNGGCRYLCLPTPNGGRSCTCPDDIDPRRCNEVALLRRK